MEFKNAYADTTRADSYSTLEFPGTYYLAYRDIPKIVKKHVNGNTALDFGCGTGRSTRFVNDLGFETIGLDISKEMINKACEIDSKGKYILIDDGDFTTVKKYSFHLITSIFTFDNIPGESHKTHLFKELRKLLSINGRIINLSSTPEIYTNEWASFSTKNFPENKKAKVGDRVKVIMLDIKDRRPVEDIIWPDEDYERVYKNAGLEVEAVYHPLGKEDENINWVSETRIPPWRIYVLKAI